MQEHGISFHRNSRSFDFPPLCDAELRGGTITISARLFGITLKRFPPIPVAEVETVTVQRRKNVPYVVLAKKDSSELAFSTQVPKEWTKAFKDEGLRVGAVYEEHPVVKAGFGALKLLFSVLATIFAVVIIMAIYLLMRPQR